MVPGMNRNRYDNRRVECVDSHSARNTATEMPDRLSLQSDGWQTCVESSTSSCTLPGQIVLSVGQVAVFQRRVDATSYSASVKRRQLLGADAESPGLFVVRRLVRDPVRMLRQRVQVLSQLRQRDPLANRNAVAHDVQVGLPKVDDPVAVQILDPRIADVPLARHGPIKYLRAGRHLVNGQWQALLDVAERVPHAVSGDAATDRIELGNEAVTDLRPPAAPRAAPAGSCRLPRVGFHQNRDSCDPSPKSRAPARATRSQMPGRSNGILCAAAGAKNSDIW